MAGQCFNCDGGWPSDQNTFFGGNCRAITDKVQRNIDSDLGGHIDGEEIDMHDVVTEDVALNFTGKYGGCFAIDVDFDEVGTTSLHQGDLEWAVRNLKINWLSFWSIDCHRDNALTA